MNLTSNKNLPLPFAFEFALGTSFNSFLIWHLAISLPTLHTKTYLFVLPERQNLRNNLYSLIRESTLCKLYQGQCWRHGNKHCETTKLNNSKINLGTKPQNPVSTPIDPVSCDETICLLLCIFLSLNRQLLLAAPGFYSVLILEPDSTLS